MASHFTVLKKDPNSHARLGRLVTPHGAIETPAFMPVGTQGTVKAVLPRDLREMGCQILLGNTYHLYLRPGHELVRKLGGLHRFMGWNGPILTDSGGYQVFSLAAMRKVSEEGARFQSHLDGSLHLLTPEKAVEIQEALGSDIAMVLDECIRHDADRKYVRDATERTIRWAERCQRARGRKDQMMFGIIQGGIFEDLRRLCVEQMTLMPFDGFAVGGLGVGEGEELLRSMSAFTAGLLPEDRPRYLMGVGRPQDILATVRAGFDMFDCVIPTRNGRNGTLFTSSGKLSIKRAEFADDPRPLDDDCRCYTCSNFSRAYLRHLFMAGEILASQLNSLHNLYFYHRLMKRCRDALRAGRAEFWDSEGAGV
ncbi:MAG TPA: tRNA guanosine(34) transglycosylase Tgt [Candidatus Binatia bacterium]|jgi:queuine tRNA-ribosyltransferase